MLGFNEKYLGLQYCVRILKARIRSFGNDRSGAFALAFAFCCVPILIALGCSFDYVQALNTHRRMQSALDAALLAAAKHVGTKDSAALKVEIANWLEAEAVQKGYYVLNTNGITIDTTGGIIKASVSATVTTTFLKIAGIKAIPVAVASAVLGGSEAVSKNAFSMYLVLDRSGSMAEMTDTTYTTTCASTTSAGRGRRKKTTTTYYTCTKTYSKIDALKLAVGNLVDQLATADPDDKYVRTGAVSYDIEMNTPLAISWGEDNLMDYVDALTANGGTNSSDAFKTAYLAVNAAAETTEHKSKNGQTPAKYIVLMTDGDNNASKSDTDTKYWCDQARANKVTVYTIAFMAPTKGQNLLKYCATTAENYFAAEDTSDLVDAFKIIGETSSKTSIRLTQ